MKNLHYDCIPDLERWKRDSSVALAWRSQDVILMRLDHLIEHYNQVKSNRPLASVVLADIFQTANAWITSLHQDQNRALEKGRYRAVLALFQASVDQLKPVFRVTSEVQVANKMKLYFGRHMHKHGYEVDLKEGRAKYLSRKERDLYRLRFKGGLAYQFPWWKAKPSLVPELTNSSEAYTEIKRLGSVGSQNYGGFVMTLDREMYMAKHIVGDRGKKNGLFHSSYTSGDLVGFAGTILIESGRIKAIRSDSGHYQPGDANTTSLLLALTMHGVDIRGIGIYDHNGTYAGMAGSLLNKNMKWSTFQDAAILEEGNIDEAEAKHKDILWTKGQTMTTRKQLADLIANRNHEKRLKQGFLRT